jgi:two-component system alkaline phosphatase synthesis response regulator PhoP
MGKRILAIDDDPCALMLISLTLELEGYQVITATDGYEGLRKIKEEKPDLLILDIMMPGMNGFDVCHDLRTDPETASLPVIMLSARTLPQDQMRGFQVGTDDYLTKPVSPVELLRTVSALLFFADRERI